MNERVSQFINSVVTKAVDDICAANARIVDCRFGVFPEGVEWPTWICLDIVNVEEPQGSGNKVEKLWAHTNDFDPLVYGWSNCEFSLLTQDRNEAIARIIAFLAGKVSSAPRVEIKYTETRVGSQFGGPTLVGDSDCGALAEPPDFPGL